MASHWNRTLEKTSQVILGGPGTGKTTELMRIVEKHIADGIDPERIAFLSFTKKGADVAANRAIDKFALEQKPKYFRTIHSLAYGELGLSRSEVMTRKDYSEISEYTGVDIKFQTGQDGFIRGAEGDMFLNIINLAHAKHQSLKRTWHEYNDFVDWFHLKYFYDSIQAYKKDVGKYDFGDMIDLYVRKGDDVILDVLIVDEAQDLSTAQWRMIKKLSKHAKYIYYAGDDDQSIYRWSGADVDLFLSLGKSNPVRVLPLSFRLPDIVFKHASRIASRIGKRYKKRWKPANHKGTLEWITSPDEIDLRKGNWILVARNSIFIRTFSELARSQGVPYTIGNKSSIVPAHIRAIQTWESLKTGESAKMDAVKNLKKYISIDLNLERGKEYKIEQLSTSRAIWHEALDLMAFDDRQYYLEMLRNGYKLTREPEVHIGTIHSVKGDEADNVVVATDLTWRSYESYLNEPDDEHRVFYVGLTRAKRNLKILMPQTSQWYDV